MSDKIILLNKKIRELKATKDLLLEEDEDISSIDRLIKKKEAELSNLMESLSKELEKEDKEEDTTFEINKDSVGLIINKGYPNVIIYNFTRSNSLTKELSNHVALSIKSKIPMEIKDIDRYIKLIEKSAIKYANQILGSSLHMYQLSVYGNGKWFSKRDVFEINKLFDDYARVYGEETKDFIIDEISVRYTVGIPVAKNIETISPTANGHDKNIRYYRGFYICTLNRTKYNCVALAYVTWNIYTEYRYLDHLRNNKMLNILSYSAYYKDNIKCIKDLRNLGHNIKILTNDEDFDKISPDDTYNYICLYYSKEHVDIIMHENYLSKDVEQYLNYFSKPRYTSYIKPKTKEVKIIDKCVNTLDLECIRYVDNKFPEYILHKVICLSYCYNTTNNCFIGYNCVNEFLDYLDSITTEFKDITFWCHYSSGYDSHLLLDIILPRCRKDVTEPIELIDTNQSIVKVTFKLEKYNLIIKDSYRMLLSPLTSLCESFKVNNPKLCINSTSFTESDFKDKDTLAVKYAMIDSLCLKEVIIKFRKYCLDNDIIDPIIYTTITSMSKDYYLRKYYPKNLSIISVLNRPAHDFIKRSYFGGITKVFIQGLHKDIYTYDISSSYPYAATKELPCGNPIWSPLNITVANNSNNLPNCKCFVECDVFAPINKKYVIPIHMYRDNNGIIVDDEKVGITYTQVFYIDEIKLGLKYGYIYKLHSYLAFTNSEPLLSAFNKDIYNLKQQAEKQKDKVKKHINKILMNSNYGSWGFNKYDKNILRIYNNNDDNLQHCSAIEELGEGQYNITDNGIYSIQKVDIDIKDTNIALASAITSIARIRLFKLAKIVEDLGYKIYYCDTDSIKTNMLPSVNTNSKRFGNNFGQAKVEHYGCANIECNIYQKKLYTEIYDDNKVVITCKGLNVKKKIRENTIILDDTTQEDLLEIHKNLKNCYINNQLFSRQETMMYTGRTNHIKDMPALYERIVTKTLKIR